MSEVDNYVLFIAIQLSNVMQTITITRTEDFLKSQHTGSSSHKDTEKVRTSSRATTTKQVQGKLSTKSQHTGSSSHKATEKVRTSSTATTTKQVQGKLSTKGREKT